MFKKIKSFFVSIFHKHQDKKVKKINDKIVEPERLSWGLVVPHRKVKPGATAYNGKETEYQYWQVVYHWFESKWQKLPTEFRDNILLKGAYGNLAKRGCNASVECHFNASTRHNAHGFECLVLAGDKVSEKYALLLVDVFKKHFPDRTIRRGNGIKYVSAGTDGALNLITAKEKGIKIAILPEMFFGDNQKDYIQHEKTADVLNEFIERSHLL